MRVEQFKVLCGLLKNVLTFFFKVVNDLEDLGFKLNTYDECIGNIAVTINHQPFMYHAKDFEVFAKLET